MAAQWKIEKMYVQYSLFFMEKSSFVLKYKTEYKTF